MFNAVFVLDLVPSVGLLNIQPKSIENENPGNYSFHLLTGIILQVNVNQLAISRVATHAAETDYSWKN